MPRDPGPGLRKGAPGPQRVDEPQVLPEVGCGRPQASDRLLAEAAEPFPQRRLRPQRFHGVAALLEVGEAEPAAALVSSDQRSTA